MTRYVIIAVIFLASCLPKKDHQIDLEDVPIVEGQIGGENYFIPEAYFNRSGNRFADDDVLLQTMFPDFLPLSKSPKELWGEGHWWKNISILLKYYPNSNLSIEDFAKNKVNFLKTFEVVGDEYGLVHQAQPSGYIADHEDVWIEKKNDRVISIIVCSEHLIEKDFPQCRHSYYIQPKLRVTVDFDKRLLKDWRLIDLHVRNMLNSFSSPEAAKDYLRNQFENLTDQAKEN